MDRDHSWLIEIKMRISEIWYRSGGEELEAIKRQIQQFGYIGGGDWTGYIEENDPYPGRQAYLGKLGIEWSEPIDAQDYQVQQRAAVQRRLEEERETAASQAVFDALPKAWDTMKPHRADTCNWGRSFQNFIFLNPNTLYVFNTKNKNLPDFYK